MSRRAGRSRLEQALSEAGVEHLTETYSGARHGFAVPDHSMLDPTSAERHWATLFKLMQESIAPET
jgi:carboxymethylenebutenolidase